MTRWYYQKEEEEEEEEGQWGNEQYILNKPKGTVTFTHSGFIYIENQSRRNKTIKKKIRCTWCCN